MVVQAIGCSEAAAGAGASACPRVEEADAAVTVGVDHALLESAVQAETARMLQICPTLYVEEARAAAVHIFKSES